MYRIEGIYDGYAADRSLAVLVSGYTDLAHPVVDTDTSRYLFN